MSLMDVRRGLAQLAESPKSPGFTQVLLSGTLNWFRSLHCNNFPGDSDPLKWKPHCSRAPLGLSLKATLNRFPTDLNRSAETFTGRQTTLGL